MGICASSTETVSEDEDELKRKQNRNRRKLSLQPNKVGAMDKTYTAQEKGDGEFDSSAQTNEIMNDLAKGNLKDAISSRKGYVPYNRGKVNQDRAIVSYGLQKDASISLFGVMDGHGEYGHNVAEFVMKNLVKYLEQQENLKDGPAPKIKAAVDNLVASLNKTRINCHFSGTTCVFGLLIDRVLHVANIGDSRAVMARNNPLPSGEANIQAIAMSHDQKPDVPEEKKRIIAAGGRVQPLPGLEGEDCGPLRVWLAEVNVPGLAMSRSIGDGVCKDVGVTHEPEVIEHAIQENDLFAIWASDGVWEFLSNEQAVDIVWKNRSNLKVAAQQLVEKSANEWKSQEEVIDDITCVIIQFNDFPPDN